MTHHRTIIRAVLCVLLFALFLTGTARAEVCWGKICSGAVCCSGNGTCESFNTCACESGYSGKECETPTFCGGCANLCNTTRTGFCTAPGISGECMCKPGYSGACCTTSVGYLFNFTKLALGVSTLDFGAQAVSNVSVFRGIEFANSTDSAVTLSAIALAGANPGDFTLGGSCAAGSGIAAGAACTVTVAFAPTAPGSRSATLNVTTDSSVVRSAALSGSGTVAANSIAGDPYSAATLYAGLDGGGIYKSTDSGATWTAATTQPTNTRIKAVVIDKNDSSKLYAASYGGGVFASTDSGVTWAACAGQPVNLNELSLVIDANGRLYAGTEAGVFVSADACATWSAMTTGLP